MAASSENNKWELQTATGVQVLSPPWSLRASFLLLFCFLCSVIAPRSRAKENLHRKQTVVNLFVVTLVSIGFRIEFLSKLKFGYRT